MQRAYLFAERVRWLESVEAAGQVYTKVRLPHMKKKYWKLLFVIRRRACWMKIHIQKWVIMRWR